MKIMSFIVILMALLVGQIKHAVSDNVGLVKAAAEGNITVVRSLLEQGKSVDSKDQKGKTALISASQHGHTALVKLLLSKGATVDAKTSRGSTAFYYAAQNHHVDSLKLLQASGANVNNINLNEFSPLSVAITNRDEKMVRLLLDYGADPNSQPAGQPLLTEALSRGSAKIFRELLDKGADVNAVRRGYGDTPLMLAVAMQRMAAVKLLLSRGANIRVKDVDGKSVLHWLVCNTYSKEENIKLLQLLLDKNADYNGQAKSLVGFRDDSTPLMCAVQRDFQKSVKALLARRADVNRKDKDGHTALYFAATKNNLTMVTELLRHGANPALDTELKRQARMRTEIGEILLTALQPSLETGSNKCPEYKEKSTKERSVADVKHYQPVTNLDPLKSQNFPVAKVEVLSTIPAVGNRFSLSPDGKWLVVRENNIKTPQEKSKRLVVFDIVKKQPFFFSVKSNYYLAEDSWLFDSSHYELNNRQRHVIDVSSGRPQLRIPLKSERRSEQLFAGGDPCPWRNSKGQVVLSRPNPDKKKIVWSADGKVNYSLQASGKDKYYLIAQRGRAAKKLIRHSAKWLRDNNRLYTEMEKEALTAGKRAKFEKFKNMLQGRPLQKLSAGRFVLSSNDRYLYYRIGPAGGSGFFGLPNRDIIVDLKSTPIQVWYIDNTPWGTPQWHPNGRDLYFINQNATLESDSNFPPLRQPRHWRLSVVRLP